MRFVTLPLIAAGKLKPDILGNIYLPNATHISNVYD